MLVVVADVVEHEPLELALVPDDGAVEQFAAQGADPPSAMLLATGVHTGVWSTLMPSVRNTSSNGSVNWLPRSRTSALTLASFALCVMKRLRAAWTVHPPWGWW